MTFRKFGASVLARLAFSASVAAARAGQKTALFDLGDIGEFDKTGQIFTNPKDPRTESYITGRIG